MTLSQPELAGRVLRQTGAFALLRSASSLSTWIAYVLLGRILEQRDFGVFEIGLFYVGLGTIVGDGGLAASLVRRRGHERRIEFQVAFTTALGLALAMGLAFIAIAPALGRANGLTQAEAWALRSMALLFVLPVFRMVPYVRLERRLDFAAIGRIELVANLLRHVTALAIASCVGGVWALLASQLVLSASQIALAYAAAPGWVGLGFRRSVFRELFGYGGKVQAGNLGLYMKDNLAGGLLGPWLGPAAVGVFRFGLQFVRVPADAVNGLARVQFPVYARLSAGDPELAALLVAALRGALLLGVPLLAALGLGAQFAVPLLYGAKWNAALPVIAALVPYVVADLLILQLITFFQGQGRAGFALAVYLGWALLLWAGCALALLLFPGSIGAVALAYSAATLAVTGYLLHAAGRHLRITLWPRVLPPLCACALGFALAAPAGRLLVRVLGLGSSGAEACCALLAFVALYALGLRALEGDAALRELKAAYRILRGGAPASA